MYTFTSINVFFSPVICHYVYFSLFSPILFCFGFFIHDIFYFYLRFVFVCFMFMFNFKMTFVIPKIVWNFWIHSTLTIKKYFVLRLFEKSFRLNKINTKTEQKIEKWTKKLWSSIANVKCNFKVFAHVKKCIFWAQQEKFFEFCYKFLLSFIIKK